MQTIHIVPTIDNEASGPSYSVTRLCETLNAHEIPSMLAALEPENRISVAEWVQFFPYSSGPRRLGVSFPMRRWLRQIARTGAVDIMHNHSLWMLPNIYPGGAVRGTNCHLVVSPRGTLSRRALQNSPVLKRIVWWLSQGRVLHRASALHATCHAEYLDIRRMGLRQPVAVLPNGVDIPVLAQQDVIKETRQLLFLGRIHPIKGIDNLLKAWKRLQMNFPAWELIIAGPDEGGYKERMQKLAVELGLKRCSFPGPFYGQAKYQVYARADLYVLPTHTENFGMTVAEALAAGTPVITTKGAPWAGLERVGAGWWVDIGVDPLEKALRSAMCKSPEELKQMGCYGREWMQRDFSWDRIAADMASFYEWVLHGGQKPSFVWTD